jgi:pyruvate dehydrogenase E2 component (dihydrolipoamide acetyltransferase)
VAYKTTEAWREKPHGALTLELDVTALPALVEELRQRPEYADVRVTVNSVMLKIIAEGLKESPEMNAHTWFNPKTGLGEIIMFDEINIATPMVTSEGRMMTPVLQDVGRKNLREVCGAMQDLRRRVDNTDLDLLLREAALDDMRKRLARGRFGVLRRLIPAHFGPGRLPPIDRKAWRRHMQTPGADRITVENLHSATVLVSNVGSVFPDVSITITLLEVIAPQTVAIGVAPIHERPALPGEGDGGVRHVLPMTLCGDHRAMDFQQTVGFIRRVTALCASPNEIL